MDEVEVCNFCNHSTSTSEAVAPTSPSASAPAVSAQESIDAIKKIFSTPDSGDARESGINNIIRRMWWWILAQGFFIGIWLGNSGDPSCHISSLTGSTYCSAAQFDMGSFFIGCLIGVGAFAPLVFVVEAIREVIRSINKSNA
jgi:hypothetical protein